MNPAKSALGRLSPAIIGKFTTFSACFDSHGKYINWNTANAFLDHMKAFKPDLCIHGGDAFDFSCLRSAATPEEKGLAILDDVDEGLNFLGLMKPTHFIRGNHDDRIYEKLNFVDARLEAQRDNDPMERTSKATSALEALGASDVLGRIKDLFKKCKTIEIPYKRGSSLKVGQQHFAHGMFCGDSAAKKMAEQYCGNVLFGHIHCFDSATLPNVQRWIGQSVGDLADDERMDYQRKQPRSLKHENGWVYGAISKKTGQCYYVLARTVGGVWFTPDIR